MGDDSREQSPDWLRSFQPPTLSTIELSSGSDTPLDYSPVSDDEDGINLSKLFKKEENQASSINDNDDGKVSVVEKSVEDKSSRKSDKVKRTPEKKRKNVDDSVREGKKGKGKEANRRNTPEKHDKSNDQNHSFWSLSSDSESSGDAPSQKKDKAIKREISPNKDLATENKKEIDNLLLNHDGESPKNQASKANSPMKKQEKEDRKTSKKNISSNINGEDDTKDNIVKEDNTVKEDNSGKHPGPQASSSKLPLLLSDKVQRSKALVECEGDFIDLSGDVGSVGRVVISDDPSKNHEMFLDLKGTIYKTTIVPSRTFCVVSFGQSEAKIEAIMNDYIQLKPQSNVYEAETMVEGTLEGFSFGSEDEADKPLARADHGEAGEEQLDGKTKRKPDKTSGPARKKGKPTGGGKPAKKVKKKPQVSKKGKTKK